MPVYNGETYIREAIDALLAQTFTDFELVITDNRSTDRTREICEDYARRDSRVRYHLNDKNLGAWGNHNRAFELSRGEYFKWASDDDWHAPTFLEKCVAVLDADSTVVAATGQTRLIYSDGSEIPESNQKRGYVLDRDGNILRMRPPERKDKGLGSPKAHVRFRGAVLHCGWCHEIYALVRRSAFAATPGMGPYYGSDKVVLVWLATMGRIVVLPEVLFHNRRHVEQSGNIFDTRQREIWNSPTNSKARSDLPRLVCWKGYRQAVRACVRGRWERLMCLLVLLAYWVHPPRVQAVIEHGLGISRRRLAKAMASRGIQPPAPKPPTSATPPPTVTPAPLA